MKHVFATAGLIALALSPSAGWAETVKVVLRNGDSLQGELISRDEESGITELNHPQLGRLELTAAELKPVQQKPAWESSVSAGLVGNTKDGDSTLAINLNADTKYQDDTQKLRLYGSFNTNKSKDEGKPLDIKTEKGSAGIRYDKPISASTELFALSNYQFNGTNDSGVNTVLGNIGLAFPVIKTDKTSLTLSIGPSLQWSGGGVDCPSDNFCGGTYGGGSLTADLSWKPSDVLRFALQNQFTTVWANESRPSNTFSAEVKIYPSPTSKLFTTIRYESIYQSMSTPEFNNTVTAQVGADF